MSEPVDLPAVPEGYKVVPIVPTEAQWDSLARDVIMWMDMGGPGDQTPRNLFRHLKNLGKEVPQWLRDEPEMQALDHVPSKGTRAAIVYRLMVEAF